jgi:hypothetical protein
MRLLAFLLALCAAPAHAELYRWVDRDTGSVKFSTSPPPWYGDTEKERTSPPVEVIRYGVPAAPKPAPAPQAEAERRRAQLPAIIDELPRAPAAQPGKPPAQ